VNQVYLDTARLLTRVAPLVFADNVFALKGGTALNLFVRDMPRLSVDLDLVFADHRLSRDEALAKINDAIRSAVDRLKKHGFQTHAATVANAGETKTLRTSRQARSEGGSEFRSAWDGAPDPLDVAHRQGKRDVAGRSGATGRIPGEPLWRKARRRPGSTAPAGLVRRHATLSQ
jgi:hypothetical protein